MNDKSYMLKKPKLQKVLKLLLEEKGISARKVASDTGIPPSTLNSLMAGSGGTKPEHLYALAKYFNKSMEYLLYGEEEESERPDLNSLPTEEVFSGWVKIKVEKPVIKKKKH